MSHQREAGEFEIVTKKKKKKIAFTTACYTDKFSGDEREREVREEAERRNNARKLKKNKRKKCRGKQEREA